MKISGNILKMDSSDSHVVRYIFKIGNERIPANELIGRKIRLEYKNQINCIKCGRTIKKSFAQGYCYPCFISIPETEECVLRPELCRAHKGIARDMEYAKDHCLIDHYVYLAESGGLKVGVTRNTQIPQRWIDQGATRAIRIALTPNRYLAGTIEVALKNLFSDKTNWRTMLTNSCRDDIDLVEERNRAIEYLHKDFRVYTLSDDEVHELNYPVNKWPEKVKSISFDKVPVLEDLLTGIRGQYLLFDSGIVINVRKHNGYLVDLEWI